MKRFELYNKPEKGPGSIIRKARVSKNISINELSYRTKIHKTLLLHLENDRYDKLPNKVYVSGFLKQLAGILEFDLVEAQGLIATKSDKVKCTDRHWNRLRVLSLKFPLFYKNPLELSKRILLYCVSGFTFSIIFIIVLMNSGLKKVESEATKKLVIKRHIPESGAIFQNLKPISITIEATHGDSWIAYKTNSNEIVTLTLKKGKNLNLKANSIRLILGNYKALKVIKNGEVYEYTGKLTKNVANIIFPEKLKEEFETPYITFHKGDTTIPDEKIDKEIDI